MLYACDHCGFLFESDKENIVQCPDCDKLKVIPANKEEKRNFKTEFWRMTMSDPQTQWEAMTPEENKKQLCLRQKHTLDLFLERNAISKAQYDKSLGDLIEKMGMQDII